MGLAALLRQASPVIDAVTGGEGENLSLIRRMALSKIKKLPVILNQSVDEGFTPHPSLNPDPGFIPANNAGQVPALGAMTDEVAGKGDRGAAVLPYVSPDGTVTAPDISKLPPEATAKILPFINKMRTDPNAPITATDPAMNESALMQRPMESAGVSVPGVVTDEHGRPMKPHFLDPHSVAARQTQQDYITGLDAYKPENHNSRFMSAMITGGRGALAGARYGPGGALGGFAVGATGGAIHPAFDEEYAKRRDLAEARGDQANEYQYRKGESDLLNDATDRVYRRAMAERALNPQYKPQVITTANGDIVSVDEGVATPVINQKTGQPFKGKQNAKHEWRNDPFSGRAELWELTPGEPDKKMIGATDASKDLVWSEMGWVKPGTALTASATAENRDFSRDRQLKQDTQHVTERAEDKGVRADEKQQARRQTAAGIVAKLETARQQWINYDAQAKQQPNYKTHFETLRDKAGAEAAGAAQELNTGFSDLYEAGIGDGGLAYYKEKPGASQALQPRPQTAPTNAKPGKILPGEDPEIRDFANHFTHGDYAAAVKEIQRQRAGKRN
jgi:hypothetical protein